jgi:hypothetical protein
VTRLDTSGGAFQAEFAGVQEEISALEIGVATMEIAVAGSAIDLISVTIKISGL